MYQEQENPNVPSALYYSALGKIVANYMGRIHPVVLETAMESRAVQALEAIRQVLDDDTYDDTECFEQVDALVMTYFRELDIPINRHEEVD